MSADEWSFKDKAAYNMTAAAVCLQEGKLVLSQLLFGM